MSTKDDDLEEIFTDREMEICSCRIPHKDITFSVEDLTTNFTIINMGRRVIHLKNYSSKHLYKDLQSKVILNLIDIKRFP